MGQTIIGRRGKLTLWYRALKKQLEHKWRALDNFEASVKKLELTRMQWRSKYSIKDGELEAAKVRRLSY